MRTGSLASALGVITGACAALVASVALAADARQVVSAVSGVSLVEVLHGSSIMSQATSGLFEESFDFSFRTEFVGRIQRDEATRGLSEPSSGGDGTPSILYTNLTSLNDVGTFSIGGVKRVGAGNMALIGGYQNRERSSDRSNGNRFDDDNLSRWKFEALYGFKLGAGCLGFGLAHGRSVFAGSGIRGSDRSENSFSGKYTKLDVGYSQPAGDKRGWSVGAWLSHTDVVLDSRSRFSDISRRDTYDVSGLSIGLRGRYSVSFGDADGEVSAGVLRGTFDLDNPLAFTLDSAANSLTERVSSDNTKRTTYDIGWRFLDRLGEKVDFAYGVQYAYSKFDSELQGRQTASDGAMTDFHSAFSHRNSDLMIPVALRFQLNPMFRIFAGAGFTYHWLEDISENISQVVGTLRSSDEYNHTTTSYAAGLRMDFNEYLSGELGLLRQAGDEAGNDRDTVQGDRLNFQFALSF